MRSLRIAARALTVGGVLLAVLAVRVVTSSHAELNRGDALRARGDSAAAILAYRRAARWYAPGNPFCTSALDRLRAVGDEARREGETERALAAFRAARGAILATRSFYTPHRERLAVAEDAIAQLTGELAPPAGRAEARDAIAEAMDAPERPSLGWTLVLLLGWLGWTGGAFAFASRALDEEDRLRPRQAQIWGTAVVVGFGLFVIGMALA